MHHQLVTDHNIQSTVHVYESEFVYFFHRSYVKRK